MSKRAAGEVLDRRYRLVKRLGRGGFGDVWRAEELLPDGTTLREVALKLLHGSVASSPDWSAEARIIASLRHPALVTVYAAGVLTADRPIPFVAMELLIGDNLGEMIQDGNTIPWRRVLSWAREAAAALDVIHLAGVVHLDLKPANLFLAEGAVKVLDFGIARQGMAREEVAAGVPLDDGPGDEMSTAAFMVQHVQSDGAADTPVTTAGGATSRSVVGTPGFMAPETFEDGEATPATDAYALAACIVQLTSGRLPQAVTGKPPTVDPDTTVGAWFAEVQAATVRGNIRPLALEDPHLPAALVRLLEQWLALDPAQRGVERGSLRAALDAVWRCPAGWQGNPYRGLAPHDARDEGKLFGRGSDVTRIGRELVDHRGVVLYGEGAIGLTSLAMAGIVPELAKHFADGKHDWLCCEIPLASMDDATSASQVVARELRAHLDRSGVPWSGLAGFLEWAAGAPVGTVVFVDDLERLAEFSDDDDMLVALIEAIAAGATGVRLVATLNAEHVTTLSERPGIGDAIRPWLRFIGPLQGSAVPDLLRGPALGAKREIPGLTRVVEQLQAEVAEDGSRLAGVSLALARWWDEPPLSFESWSAGGGLLGRLSVHADDVFEALDAADRAVADNVLVRTVSVDGSSTPVAERTLLEASQDPPRLRRVIDVLVRERLVMRDRGHLRLAHIGLAKAWRRLNDLRLHDIDRLSFLEDLRNAAGRWAAAGSLRKNLWPSEMLSLLTRRRSDLAGELGDTERAFIAASLRARRVRWALQAVAAAAVVAILGLAYLVNLRVEHREAMQRARLADARKLAALERMVTASRRTVDPYQRVALLSGAIREGSGDPLLALELAEAGRDLPPAEFFSLTTVARPDFPWGERWLLGATPTELVLFDFEPPAGEEWAPMRYRFRPHRGNLTDIVPFPFDTAVVTRDQRGEVSVWRLREEGQVALAARAPEACALGPVVVASDAPVVACTTAGGVARWDLRAPSAMTTSHFEGRVLDVSRDGQWVVAARLRKLLLWNASSNEQLELSLDEAASVARVSPRDAVVAVVSGAALDVFRLSDASKLVHRDVLIRDPVVARWADSGVDLAICDYDGQGEWHYLRKGGRAADDPPLPTDSAPCRKARFEWPKPLHDAAAFGRIGLAAIGPRVIEDGWQREDGKLVTRDLVMFDPKDDGLRRRLQITGFGEEAPPASASAVAVFRDDDGVVWQVGDEIRRHDGAGKQVASWRGNLLTRCPNGRLLAWRRQGHADDAPAWEIFGARVDVLLATVPRVPGNVLGADPDCQRVVFQWLDGQIATLELDGETAHPSPIDVPGGGFVVDGYVHDVRPSRARPATAKGTEQSSGLWLALSSGAMVRIDGASGAVTGFGHAQPLATAMADGPRAGELLFADDRGVTLRTLDGADRLVLAPLADHAWEDIVVGPDAKTLWLSWAHGVTVIDIALGDVLGELDVPAHDRLAPWDDGGSVLLWPFSYKGEPRGRVIPVNPALAAEIGDAASNIRAELGDDYRAVLRLDD